MSFADDTAVKRTGDRCFVANLDARWLSLVGIHGGYSAATVARAMAEAVADPARALRTLPPNSRRHRVRARWRSK